MEDEVDGEDAGGESSAGTEGDETKCWKRRPRRGSSGSRPRSAGSGSDAEEVRNPKQMDDPHQPARKSRD